MSRSVSILAVLLIALTGPCIAVNCLAQSSPNTGAQGSAQSSSQSSSQSASSSSVPPAVITVIGRARRDSGRNSDGSYIAIDYRNRSVGSYRRRSDGRATVVTSFGDASDGEGEQFLGGFADPMRALNAGRAYIIANDHSLEDALAAFDAGDHPKALKLFKAAYTKMGYPVSALIVGKMYLYGVGTPKDAHQAVIWLKKAARFPPYRSLRGIYAVSFYPDKPDARDAILDAVMTLGYLHIYGIEVSQDFREAQKWYTKANSWGFAPAGDILGQIYQKGYGVPISTKTAFAYYKGSAELNYGPAQYHLARLYYDGAPDVAIDKKKAMDWFYSAARHGVPDALFVMGRAYDEGEGVAADPEKAVVYYKEAAVKGQADAQNALGIYFYEGKVVPKDIVTARKCFEQAAMQGQVDGMFNLAAMYYRGEGGDKDLTMAYVWFTLARAGGHPQADAALKIIEPQLTPEDRTRADSLLKPAEAPKP